MAKRPRKLVEAENQAPLFVFDRDFVESLKAPYEPPPSPRSKAEALFFLSWNGRDYLSDLTRLLRAYIDAIQNSSLPVEVVIADKETEGCSDTGEGLSSRHQSLPDLAVYFSGFGALGEWLSQAYALAFDKAPAPSAQAGRLLNCTWIEGFSHDVGLQQDIDIIRCLDSGLSDIHLQANHQWTVEVFWTLVLEYLERAGAEGEEEYANDLAMQDKNRIDDRRKLFESFDKAGIFNVRFSHYISEDEDVFLDESEYRPLISWLKRTLLSESVMSFDEMHWDAAQEWVQFTGKGIPNVREPLSQDNQLTSPVDESRNSPSPDKKILSADQLDISVKDENAETHPTTTKDSGNLRKRTVLVKVALKYLGKNCVPTASGIRYAAKKRKKIPKIFHAPLNELSSATITRAVMDMQSESYEFDKGYRLSESSYDRLKKEVTDNLKAFQHLFQSDSKVKT